MDELEVELNMFMVILLQYLPSKHQEIGAVFCGQLFILVQRPNIENCRNISHYFICVL